MATNQLFRPDSTFSGPSISLDIFHGESSDLTVHATWRQRNLRFSEHTVTIGNA